MSQIETVLGDIQLKWGQKALQSARNMNLPLKVYSSGFAALDARIGGIPQAQITEITGLPSSGLSTLAYKSLAAAQKASANIMVIERQARLDMLDAAASGVKVEDLIMVETAEPKALLNLLRELLNCASVDYILVNLMGFRETLNLQPLLPILRRSDCALVLLVSQPIAANLAALRLRLSCHKWLRRSQDIIGCLSSVRIEKERYGKAGQEILLLLPFAEEVWE